MGIYSSPSNWNNDLELLEEVATRLQTQISKLTSRRLHLQSLIAKRDRLDYEIRILKQRIREDRKVSTRTVKSVKEETIPLLESKQEKDPWYQSPQVATKLRMIEQNIEDLENEEELIDLLETVPRPWFQE